MFHDSNKPQLYVTRNGLRLRPALKIQDVHFLMISGWRSIEIRPNNGVSFHAGNVPDVEKWLQKALDDSKGYDLTYIKVVVNQVEIQLNSKINSCAMAEYYYRRISGASA